MIKEWAVWPKRQTFRKHLPLYALMATALLLVSCTSAISPASPDKVGSSAEQTQFFFNGEDFESRKASIAKPAVRGYQQIAPMQRLKTGWPNDTLSRELVAHKRAIALAKSSEVAAKRYAKEAEALRIASQNASGNAGRADSSSRSQQRRAAMLQKRASEKSRIARQARQRAARLKQKADAEARLAQKNMELAKAASIQARKVSLQASAERDRARRLRLQAQQENRLGAGKSRARDEAYRQASALEKRAHQRSMNLRNRLGKNEAERKKALQLAHAARIRAEHLSRELASHKKNLARFESHELALKTNR